jgi:hypothetical protein
VTKTHITGPVEDTAVPTATESTETFAEDCERERPDRFRLQIIIKHEPESPVTFYSRIAPHRLVKRTDY